jgi:hypothetical protein
MIRKSDSLQALMQNSKILTLMGIVLVIQLSE